MPASGVRLVVPFACSGYNVLLLVLLKVCPGDLPHAVDSPLEKVPQQQQRRRLTRLHTRWTSAAHLAGAVDVG